MFFVTVFIVLLGFGIFLVVYPIHAPHLEMLSKIGIAIIAGVLTLMVVHGNWEYQIKNAAGELGELMSKKKVEPSAEIQTVPTTAAPSASPPKVVLTGTKVSLPGPLPPKMDHVKIEYMLGGEKKRVWLYPLDAKEYTFPDGATDIAIQFQDRDATVYSEPARIASVP